MAGHRSGSAAPQPDLRIRVQRLLRGGRRHDDVDRLFLGLRDRAGDRMAIREIGDFVAHRDERDRGTALQQTSDVLLSIQTYLKIRTEGTFTLVEIREVAEANLRVATPAQLSARLRLTRPEARGALKRGLAKLERGGNVTRKERRTIDYLGGAFIWNPDFTDASLHRDFADALVDGGYLSSSERSAWKAVQPFISLCVVSLMNGTTLVLNGSNRVTLMAGYDNNDGLIEVKAQLQFEQSGKQVRMPFCLYLTALRAEYYCDPVLLAEPKHWEGHLDVLDDRLVPMA